MQECNNDLNNELLKNSENSEEKKCVKANTELLNEKNNLIAKRKKNKIIKDLDSGLIIN